MTTCSKPEIRHASLSDLDAIVGIEKAGIGMWTQAMIHAELESDTAQILVATVADRIRGYAIVRILPDDVELLSIAVNPECQRFGIGKALMRECIEQNNTTQRFLLEVSETNQAALIFYHSIGFREFNRRKNYFGKPYADRSRDRKSGWLLHK